MYDNYDDVPFDVNEYQEDADITEELYKEDVAEGPIDMVTANYYVGLVKKNKAKEAEYKEQAKQMLEDFKYKIDRWLTTRQRALDFSTQYYLSKLEAFDRENQPANGKSLSLPEGNIGFYSVAAKFDFDSNKEQIIKILEANPDLKRYLRYTPAINKTDLKKAISVSDEGQVYIGETLLPNVGYEPKTVEFKTR